MSLRRLTIRPIANHEHGANFVRQGPTRIGRALFRSQKPTARRPASRRGRVRRRPPNVFEQLPARTERCNALRLQSLFVRHHHSFDVIPPKPKGRRVLEPERAQPPGHVAQHRRVKISIPRPSSHGGSLWPHHYRQYRRHPRQGASSGLPHAATLVIIIDAALQPTEPENPNSGYPDLLPVATICAASNRA